MTAELRPTIPTDRAPAPPSPPGAPRPPARAPAGARATVPRIPAAEIKLLLTALAAAATVGGWAAISQEGGQFPASAPSLAESAASDRPATNLASAQAAPPTRRRAVTLPPANAPRPVAITRSSR